MTLEEVFNVIKDKQVKARNEIYTELKNRDKSLKIRAYPVGKSKKYKNYIWLQVEKNINIDDFQGKLIYWITFFAIDIDINSGNPHIILGDIQFWKDIQKHSCQNAKCKIVNRYGPNEKINVQFEKNENSSKNGNAKWCLCIKKSKNTKWNVDSYNLKFLVDEFIKFMNIK